MVLTSATVGYKDKTVLNSLNYAFSANKLTVIVGKNGCGKSTLLKSMASQIPLLSGNISLKDKNICDYKKKELARMLAYLPQIRDTPNIIVKSLVEHGRFPYLGFPRILTKNDNDAARNAMQKLDVLKFSKLNISSLSGGERQRVYLALTLAQDTNTILLDEPTTFIDISDTYKILEIMKEEAKSKTIIMVLHDLACAMRYADEIVVIDSGEIAIAAPPSQIFLSNIIPQIFKIDVKKLSDTDYYFYKS